MPKNQNPNTFELKLHKRELDQQSAHEYYFLVNALQVIARGKTGDEAFMWGAIAGKFRLAQMACEGFHEKLPTLVVKLMPEQATVLWAALRDLPPEAYGRNEEGQHIVPPLPMWFEMMTSLAEQNGEELPEVA